MTVIKGDGVDKSELGLRIFQLTGFAKDNGAHLQYLTDFEDYRSVVEEYSEVGAVTGILDNRISRIGPENGFWVIATNDAAKLIHIQAVRYEYLKGQTLSQHWLNDPAMYAPAWLDLGNLLHASGQSAQAHDAWQRFLQHWQGSDDVAESVRQLLQQGAPR